MVARYLGGNPNGSYRDIAGICNEGGNVVGLMPHPEHAVEALTGPSTDGLGFFTSVLGCPRVTPRLDTRRQAPPATPGRPQPYAALGLKDDEYARIREILGRRPTSSELAMYSVMWTEHCSYKSSKVHLQQFGEKVPDNAKDVLLIGMGENAGVVDVGNGWAVTFKVESHNHPSYVEPHQGAATGVGGIVRDILTMGARPVAVMDPLRFGAVDAPDTARCPGVVGGIGCYGNCLGLPEHRRRGRLRPVLQRQPARQCLVRRRSAHRRHPARPRRRPRQQGRAVRLPYGWRRHRRCVGARVGDLRRRHAVPAAERADGRPVRREAAHRVLHGDLRRATSSSASRTSARPGCPAPRPNSPPPAPVAWTSTSTWHRCATPRWCPKRS